jgi:hypothetical protein
VKRWPLFLIALPAAVAIWSGWVGLGGMCGFGVIHPLPGIVPDFELNTAVTLPVGVEAFAAFALGVWLRDTEVPGQARRFARWSAVAALSLGMLGQVVFHLLAAAGATRAPWPVVVLVSCLPVAVLGLAAALAHLMRTPEEKVSATTPTSTLSPVPARVPIPPVRQVRDEYACSAATAKKIRAGMVAAVKASNGHAG